VKLRFSTDEVLRALPPLSAPLMEAILAAAERSSAAIYLVGGPVRDLLLGQEVRDVDLVVEAGRLDAAKELALSATGSDMRVIEHGRFGTVRVESGDAHLDIATTRRETYARPGALPQVEPCLLEEDLGRRDFTVNALALRLSYPGSGRRESVQGVTGGLSDLEEGALRTLHEKSFHDDPTRILRAARLAPRLGFFLARSARREVRSALRDGVFGSVSGDRLRREFEALFEDARRGMNPALALRNLANWHVLSVLEPGLGLSTQSVAPLRRLGRILSEPLWRGPRQRAWVAGLSTWLAAEKPAMRRRTLQRLSVRGALALRIAGFPKDRDTRLRGLSRARGRGAVDAVLVGLDEESLLGLYSWAEAPARRRIERWAAEDRVRRSPVSGADLLKMGLSGPALGRALGKIREAYLDGGVANREEALALAAEIARRKPRAARATRKPKSRPE